MSSTQTVAPPSTESIPQLRASIDRIDEAIAALMLQRRELSHQIQHLRIGASQARRSLEREQQIFDAYRARLGRRGVDLAHAVLRICLPASADKGSSG